MLYLGVTHLLRRSAQMLVICCCLYYLLHESVIPHEYTEYELALRKY